MGLRRGWGRNYPVGRLPGRGRGGRSALGARLVAGRLGLLVGPGGAQRGSRQGS